MAKFGASGETVVTSGVWEPSNDGVSSELMPDIAADSVVNCSASGLIADSGDFSVGNASLAVLSGVIKVGDAVFSIGGAEAAVWLSTSNTYGNILLLIYLLKGLNAYFQVTHSFKNTYIR